MGNFFFKAYRLIARKRKLSLAVLLLVVMGLATIVSKIQFEDDITSLIPANEEAQRIQKVLKSITFTDKIIISIQKDEEGSVNDLTQYAKDLLDSLEQNQSEFIKNVQGRVNSDDVPKTLDLVYEHLPLFLEPDDYPQIAQKINSDSIAHITAENYRTLISPSGIVTKKTIVKDPLRLSFIALKRLQELGVGEDFKLKNGFLVDQEEKNILLFLTPAYGSNETDKNLPFSDALYELQNQLNAAYTGKVHSEYYGAALVAVANAKQIRSDIQFTVSIAMTLLIVILMLFYRKLALPFILFLPTLIGALLSIAFLCILREKISAISLGIGSVLLGVTLDYALHILTHIRNGNGAENLYKEVAPSILMSSLTTASAFLCLLFLESQALQDLGIFAAVSVLGASVFALLFVPQVYSAKKAVSSRRTILDRVASFDFHKSKWAIMGLVLFSVISIFTYNKVVFNKDIARLNYETELLRDARKRLETLTDISSKSIYLATYGNDTQTVLGQNDSLYNILKTLEANDKILSFSSVGGLIRTKRTQEEKIALWKDFWSTNKIKTTQRELIESGNEFGFKPTTFNKFYDLLNADFEPLEVDDFVAIKSFSLDDYIVKDENGTTITSLIKVDEDHIDLIREQFENSPNTLLIDRQQVNETFLGNLKNDFNSLIGYSLIVVLFILFFFYRSLSLTVVTSIPIFLTWFLTVGIMGLFHIEFNIFNIIICSFIFGLGVDYSIFITNGLLTEYRTGEKVLHTHKTSILLSVITTIAGVGVLIFAKHPVLYTISTVSLIGILSAAFVAFTVQPLLFRLFIGSTDKRPISLRYFIHSVLSFGYFGTGGFLYSIYGWAKLKLSPQSRMEENIGFHRAVSKLMGSVLYTNPFVSKKIKNLSKETFEKPVMIIANHTSFLDILAIGMLHPKIVFLVNDWVYNSPVFGSAAKLAGAYPVSGGIENGEAYLKEKVAQGFSLIAFPEGTRSSSNKIKRFHKGAFYLAQQFELDILPVLIHGNSEVLPKGSFIIRDGSITVELLPKIKANDPKFGKNYSERAKQLGAYFRKEFQRLRNEIEDQDYWTKTLLENYRYKGDVVYKSVKLDLAAHKETYASLLKHIGKKTKMVHLSQDFGQLDLMLALDSIDRKITTYLADHEAALLLKNNFLTQNYSKISLAKNVAQALEADAELVLVDIKMESRQLAKLLGDTVETLILLKEAQQMELSPIEALGFVPSQQNDNFRLLKKRRS
ncbi:1-acyl-sn-glycerol-3-phosphate acyltransferase [Zobellia galactanivorans]|uniref:1-acyl-sn-glycerol-3-phosphate acyltransferase n=1 Tax=Zobellia galactanivorans (strain DSM 12802 / CCUG 47099 / CIP 106680 / NCIMB 13871 / Dsij) TaxID=63186 RepID=UPI001C0656BC|nr:1-acyl-sn-glycerol-3-phosphate acyltransferase [Zobellia galactanivorans]MBU3026429.1 MMPL family transporter [Zobellia galactanivorans]